MSGKKLSVPAVGQYEGEWCGPACAQMILLSGGKVENKTKKVQKSLFDDIVTNTHPNFPIKEQCPSSTLDWETFPTALETTLNARMGASTVKVHDDAGSNASTARVIRSVNSETAPAVLTQDSTHWMVIFGWDDKQSVSHPLPELEIDGEKITHLFVRDPAWSYKAQIDTETWTALQYKVVCGKFKNRFVVVGAT